MPDEPRNSKPPDQPQPSSDVTTWTFTRTFTLGKPPPKDPNVVEAPEQTIEWKWGGLPQGYGEPTAQAEATDDSADELVGKPMTYYEALSGKRDPMRNFFVKGRRLLNLSVTLMAIALPIGLMTLAFVTGADWETIVWVGIGAAIVGVMFKASFPKTPFD